VSRAILHPKEFPEFGNSQEFGQKYESDLSWNAIHFFYQLLVRQALPNFLSHLPTEIKISDSKLKSQKPGLGVRLT
jgi:hypothetical protein